jgi:long-chain fatty acid transport protein
VLASLICSLAGPAWAGGYFYSDSGVVATGRGGAWIAGADTQFAQYHNPAGLIHIGAPTVTVGWSGVQQHVDFTRQKEDGSFYPEIQNQASPFDVPEGGFFTPLGDRLVLGVGFTSPFAPSSLYDEEGPQRYSVKDTSIYQFSVGPSAAVRVHDMLVLGVGLQWQYLNLFQSVDVTTTGQDDPKGDIAVEARAVDVFTPNANLGLLLQPHDMLTIGLSAQPPTKFHAKGSMALDFEGHTFATTGILTETSYRDEDVSLDIAIPWVLRAGVAVRPIPRLEIETAVVWQDWSALENITVQDVDIAVEVDEDNIFAPPEEQRKVDEQFAFPAGLRDTVSLRLGAELDVHPRVAVRAGGFWENGAVSPQEMTVALMDSSKIQLGGGGTVWAVPDRLRFDVAFAYLLFRSLEIRDSTVTQTNAGISDSITPMVIGNGDLASRGWVVGLAGSVSFPAGKGKGLRGKSP